MTLFGITLATGLVVDDAIVVIENVQRHISEGVCRRARGDLDRDERGNERGDRDLAGVDLGIYPGFVLPWHDGPAV